MSAKGVAKTLLNEQLVTVEWKMYDELGMRREREKKEKKKRKEKTTSALCCMNNNRDSELEPSAFFTRTVQRWHDPISGVTAGGVC